jgi:hypothetical protein
VRPVGDVVRVGVRTAVPTYLLGVRVRRLEGAVVENARLEVPLTEQLTRLEASLVPLMEGAADPELREPRDGHA